MAASNGSIYLYDLQVSASAPIAVLKQPQAGPKGAAVHTVAFNARMRSFLATGDSNGNVHVWNLSWNLANIHPGEKEELDRFVRGMEEGGEEEVGEGGVAVGEEKAAEAGSSGLGAADAGGAAVST